MYIYLNWSECGYDYDESIHFPNFIQESRNKILVGFGWRKCELLRNLEIWSHYPRNFGNEK